VLVRKMDNKSTVLSEKVKELFTITNELESLYPGRKFTIDGHTIGSIGEVLVAEKYNLELLKPGYETYDAKDKNGNLYQIKATQIDRISLSSCPQNLIVIKFYSDGNWEIVYNGDGKLIWDNAGKMQKNGQKQITLSKIEKLQEN
jgi:hypothetical protein